MERSDDLGISRSGHCCCFHRSRYGLVITRSGQLSIAQNLLNIAKDRQLEADLKQKDLEIEREKMARLKLAEEISWRTPDRTLIAKLSPPLRSFEGQRSCFVVDPAEPERSAVLGWIVMLLGDAHWKMEPAPASPKSELTFGATNIVLWVTPDAPTKVVDAARAMSLALENGGLPAVVLQSSWGPKAAPPELIRIVLFKKGPRMKVSGNMITFEGSPTRTFFGDGPPH